jgi:hypothetical protein
MKKCLNLLAVPLLAASSLSVHAATIYVDNSAAPGGVGTLVSPYNTLEAALAVASPGDEVSVAYTGNAYTSPTSTPFTIADNNLTLRGVSGPGGELPILRSGDNARHTVLINGTGVTVTNLQIHLVMDADVIPAGAAYTNDRGAIFADNTSSRVFDNLTVSNCTFAVEGNGKTSWRHIGVRAYNGGGTKETITVLNSRFIANPYSGSFDAGVRSVYQNSEVRFSKAVHGYDVKMNITQNDMEGFFRDVHIETPDDFILQSNTFRNSVEVTSPSTSGIATGAEFRVIDNRFLGEVAIEHFYNGFTANLNPSGTAAGTDQAGAVGFDGDYYASFTTSISTYAGRIPAMVAGYQDELLFVKGNIETSGAGTPRLTIERNYFVTRRKGINIARSTNLLIKRNLFVSNPASSPDMPLPSPNPFGIVYPNKAHISIDKNYYLTCCYGSDLPAALELEIIANDFEGAGATAVLLTDEMPASGTPGGRATTTDSNTAVTPAGFAESLIMGGNDIGPGVTVFNNDYLSDPNDINLDGNYYEGATTIVTGSGAGTTSNNGPAAGTQVNDSDGDTLWDGEELQLYGTNPNNPDTDGDGWSDSLEIVLRRDFPTGYDPLLNTLPGGAPPVDTDGDGIPDAFDPSSSLDGNSDRIKDGYAYLVTYNPYGPVTLGDVNSDGLRNDTDAIQVLEVFLRIQILTGTSNDYDVNRDGVVDNVDAVILYAWSLGNIPYIPFP